MNATAKSVPAGDRAVLIDLGDVTAAELHAAAAEQTAQGHVCIVGHSSLYVLYEQSGRRRHVTRVRFDGEDLPEFLARIGMTRDAFRRAVASLRLTARYLGFRGGFAYLDGWPEEWAMPRRATSRPVRAGTFAIAGNVAGFYPLDTPGGWNLLGHTDELPRIAAGDEIVVAPLFDVDITAPLATLVTKPDYAKLTYGDPPGGAFDELAAALAHRVVGNAEDAPVLECPLTGPRIVAHEPCVAAWVSPSLSIETRSLAAGEEWSIGRISDGMRGYLAIGQTLMPVPAVRREAHTTIRAMRGPHDVAIDDEIECEVTPQLNRVGIRLRPLRALPEAPADLRSCGMQCGTVQLHPDGSLVAMGPDHPITGGYLQPLTVLTEERWKLAQLAPGERVTLVTGEQ
ncbi:MAG TPA: carboxyltransferase domain-containing protein [Thermoanaerobaculia bacterium]